MSQQRIRRLSSDSRLYKLVNPRLSLSIVAQATVSGFHFLLHLWLVKTLSLHDYGLFAFAFVLVMFGNAINNALISTPLTVYTPVIKDPWQRDKQEIMLGTANVVLVIALLFILLCYGFVTNEAVTIAVATAVFVAANAARQFSRSTGYARLRPLITASGEICYVASAALILLLSFVTAEELRVSTVLLILAGAQLLSIAFERFKIYGLTSFRLNLSSLSAYAEIWPQSRWGLIGAVTTLLMGQAHSLIITSSMGPAAFAPLAAGFVLFGPIRVALMTWQNLVKPEIAIALSNNEHDKVKRQLWQTGLYAAVAAVVLSIGLALCWRWIYPFLYADKYADQPMAQIVMLWGLITLVAALYNAPSAALQALKDFRILAWASIYGAVISVLLVTILLFHQSTTDTLYGILAAEVFTLVFLVQVIRPKLSSAP